MSAMTYAEAQLLAVKMNNQGATFPKIADHLKAIGYKSPKTKEPITSLAVRHMIGRWKEDQNLLDRQDKIEEIQEKKIMVVADVKSLEAELLTILTLSNLSEKTKNDLAVSLLRSRKEEANKLSLAKA